MKSLVENGPFADDLRIKSGSFSIAMLVYQRVLMVIGDYVSNSLGNRWKPYLLTD